MENSKIEWTHHSQNLWSGCTKVHAGCNNCYAETMSHRWGNDVWGQDKPRLEVKSAFEKLAKFQRDAQKANEIKRVFVGSMMDIFEMPMPVKDNKGELKTYDTGKLRSLFFYNISRNLYPNLEFLLLTKRPSNINKIIPDDWKETPPANVLFGTSISEQSHAQRLIDILVKVKGRRFLSIEPQLTEIKDIDLTGIDWVIQGGESGHYKRPFELAWAYTMRDICQEQNVPFFFKQIDKIQPIPDDLMIREFYKPNYLIP